MRGLNILARNRLDLSGKVALVTGGGDGIGKAAANALIERGALVAILDRDAEAAKRVAGEIGEHLALPIAVDVTDRNAMELAVKQAIDHFGRLDVVVANAGITPRLATLRALDSDEFDRVMAVNLTGVLNTVKPAIRSLVENRGHILVVASVAVFSPPVGGAVYMVAKAGVEVLARALRLELAAHGVTVTTSYFGVVDTALARNMTDDPVGREMLDFALPWPLSVKITPAKAGRTIARGIERRATTTVMPRSWAPVGVLRGILNPPMDAFLVRSKKVARIQRLLEGSTGIDH